MKREEKLKAEYLREAVHYDPETGEFTRRIRTGARTHVGDVLGTRSGHGYLKIALCGTQFYAHRAAFLYMTGIWPELEVDHIDGDRENNRWANLRQVTRSENNQNHKGARVDSRSSLIGVIKHGKSSHRARIKVDGKMVLLGSHPTPEAAFSAFVDAKRKLHPAGTL